MNDGSKATEPNTTEPPSKIVKYGGGFILICVFIVIIAAIIQNKNEEDKPKEKPKTVMKNQFDAEILIKDKNVVIKNTGNFTWKPSFLYHKSIGFVINGKYRNIYKKTIAPNQVVTFSLSSFYADKIGYFFSDDFTLKTLTIIHGDNTDVENYKYIQPFKKFDRIETAKYK